MLVSWYQWYRVVKTSVRARGRGSVLSTSYARCNTITAVCRMRPSRLILNFANWNYYLLLLPVYTNLQWVEGAGVEWLDCMFKKAIILKYTVYTIWRCILKCKRFYWFLNGFYFVCMHVCALLIMQCCFYLLDQTDS